MKIKNTLVFLFVITLLACKPNDDAGLPVCIKELLAHPQTSENIKSIRKQVIDNEAHYWINTDERHEDDIEHIVNENCESVCYYCGECPLPECIDEYNEDWELIWVF